MLPSERYYLPQETGNYSVAGFRMIMSRKVSHYIITYYIPSGGYFLAHKVRTFVNAFLRIGLFVVVSWASFLIPCDDIQVRSVICYMFSINRLVSSRSTGSHGAAGDSLPGAGQHIQRHHHKLAKGGWAQRATGTVGREEKTIHAETGFFFSRKNLALILLVTW